MNEYLLILLILIPLIFAGLVALLPKDKSYAVALAGTLFAGVFGLYSLLLFNPEFGNRFQFEVGGATGEHPLPWFSSLGIYLSLGVDSIAYYLLLLTLLLGPICVIASKSAITERVKTYYTWLLVLQAAMTGVFCARDLVFFYICFEFTLVPMYVLISLYGSTNRAKAATKFFLYTFTGSLIALAGLVYIVWNHAQVKGVWTFDIAALEQTARLMPAHAQTLVMFAMLLGFAVKVPLFPFHTWLPLAHTEAPTAGSVILAGVLLKLGTYGIYRFVLGMVPDAVVLYAPFLATLSIIGIIYGGLICWVQTDVKKLVAYSSVAHLGFCMLGMFALNNTGLSGSIMYMINHGLSTGALFLLIGMIYERYHTRNMKELGGLAAKMPIWATFMVFFAMASVGLPGLNGFVSEFMCLLGAFQSDSGWATTWGAAGPATVVAATGGELGPWYAAVAGTGMIIAAIYLLYMVGKVVFGPLVEPHGHASHGHDAHGHDAHGAAAGGADAHQGVLPRDLSGREIGILIPLAVLCLALGLYPTPVLDGLKPAVTDTAVSMTASRQRLAERGLINLPGRIPEGLKMIPASTTGKEAGAKPADEAKPAKPHAEPDSSVGEPHDGPSPARGLDSSGQEHGR